MTDQQGDPRTRRAALDRAVDEADDLAIELEARFAPLLAAADQPDPAAAVALGRAAASDLRDYAGESAAQSNRKSYPSRSAESQWTRRHAVAAAAAGREAEARTLVARNPAEVGWGLRDVALRLADVYCDRAAGGYADRLAGAVARSGEALGTFDDYFWLERADDSRRADLIGDWLRLLAVTPAPGLPPAEAPEAAGPPAAIPAPPPTRPDTTAPPKPAARFLAASELAQVLGVPHKYAAVESALRRHHAAHPGCREDVPNPRRGEPQYLYRVDDVWDAPVDLLPRWGGAAG